MSMKFSHGPEERKWAALDGTLAIADIQKNDAAEPFPAAFG
jgi:hypothetical protein